MGEVVFCLTGWNVPLFFENNAPKVLSLAVKKQMMHILFLFL